MALLGIAATVLAVVPLADRCRAVLADAACISEVDVPALPPLNCSVPPDVDPDAGGFCLFSLPGVPSADLPFAGLMADWTIPEAARPGVSLSVPAVRDADVRPPEVGVSELRAMTAEEVSNVLFRLVYDALADGSVNVRAREWRLPLVRMLVEGTPGTDFDRIYAFLFRGFPGADERAKIRALANWAEKDLWPHEAADVYRAETRYWLNLGDSEMTADAAGRMERARPGYAVRACRLRALAYATAGELEEAKAEIARSRAVCEPPPVERLELLYLEAWIWLQEGDVAAARRNLASIVAESPHSALARKAREVLASVSEEGGAEE